jgi:hypothetical protein
MHKAQRLINHVAIVLDASYSMSGRESAVVRVTDNQIKYLAKRSEELSQETRISVYRFGDRTIECLIFDMDVMRLPGTADLYTVLRQNTALIDATMKSQEDLETTSQLYGDHAFLTFVLTDGQENDSRNYTAKDLQNRIFNAPDNWSMGFLVPDARGQSYMERLGVLKDSVAIWDQHSATGLTEAATKIQQATDNFMVARAKGVRGTRSVFGTGIDVLNERTVPTTLTPMDSSKYRIFPVTTASQIRTFVEAQGYHYSAGMAYYQLTKRETIQARKQIIVIEKATDKAYEGKEARHLIGLPDGREVRVSPDDNPKYDVYVQSTSVNRKLVPGTYDLVVK